MPGVFRAQYADDTAILYKSISPAIINNRLQQQLNKMQDWCSTWRMPVNPEKSTAILLTRRQLVPDGPLQFSGKDITWNNSVKYLGVTLDKGLRWRAHVREKIMTYRSSTARLFPLLRRRSHMSLNNKLRVYDHRCLPSLGLCLPQPY